MRGVRQHPAPARPPGDDAGRIDAVVVGSGPNGLAAAIEIARAGRSVLVLEAEETVGGGCRSAELTLPGFVHDRCSAIHPWPLASPFLRSLPLDELGVELVHPPAPLAHPLDDGSAAVLERSVEATGRGLGPDGDSYAALLGPLVRRAPDLLTDTLAPLRRPRHPLLLGRFGRSAARSAAGLATARFEGPHARALLGGLAAHSMLSLRRPPSAAVGLMLAVVAHACGWPLVKGGSQRLADALAAHLRSLGGEIETGRRVTSLADLPPARAVLLDVGPHRLAEIARERLPARYRRTLERYRYGPGVFKLDWALDGPVPWTAPACARAATVHLGGTLAEVADAEQAVQRGEHPERPFVLLSQQTPFDPTRAPGDAHTLWAYCHVPGGSTFDMTARIEAQVERFAPGFGERVLARSATDSAAIERHDANYVGGDINGGIQDLRQLFARPALRLDPYTTPARELYICSSSTPPGGGVHGMCGYFAARSALRRSL